MKIGNKLATCGVALVLVSTPAIATAHHEASPPKVLNSIKYLKKHQPALVAAEFRRPKPSWNHLFKVANQRWLNTHRESLAYAYHLAARGRYAEAVERTFDVLAVPEATRRVYRCIAGNEGLGYPDVWYSGDKPGGGLYTGWIPAFAGSDRVNGWFQIRPYHTPTGSAVVTYETYHYTSDVVWSTEKAVSLGLGPFFAQAGNCF